MDQTIYFVSAVYEGIPVATCAKTRGEVSGKGSIFQGSLSLSSSSIGRWGGAVSGRPIRK